MYPSPVTDLEIWRDWARLWSGLDRGRGGAEIDNDARMIIVAKLERLAKLEQVLAPLLSVAEQPLDLPPDLALVAARPLPGWEQRR